MRPILTSANDSGQSEQLVRVAPAERTHSGNGHVAGVHDVRPFRVRWSRHLTVASSPALCQAVRDALTQDVQQLWLDLRAVAVIDVVGLAAVLQSARAAAEKQVEFSV